jgi:hypothetical protein
MVAGCGPHQGVPGGSSAALEDVCSPNLAAGPLAPGIDGNEAPPGPGQEFGACNDVSDCACPMTCVTDPVDGRVCEFACNAISDCPDPTTICGAGNTCVHNYCWELPNGSSTDEPPDGTCNAGDGTGTCVPLTIFVNPDVPIPAIGSPPPPGVNTVAGFCFRAGTATGGCSAPDDVSRSDPAGLCPQGSYCLSDGESSSCEVLCDAVSPGTGSCPAGSNCHLISPVADPWFGVCDSCHLPGDACNGFADCCLGSCTNSVCDACGLTGSPCTQQSDCCIACTNGVCN